MSVEKMRERFMKTHILQNPSEASRQKLITDCYRLSMSVNRQVLSQYTVEFLEEYKQMLTEILGLALVTRAPQTTAFCTPARLHAGTPARQNVSTPNEEQMFGIDIPEELW